MAKSIGGIFVPFDDDGETVASGGTSAAETAEPETAEPETSETETTDSEPASDDAE